MTYLQLTVHRPTVLVHEGEMAVREAVQGMRALTRLVWFLVLVLWDGMQAWGFRWDSQSRFTPGRHREINDRAPLLLIVLFLTAIGWGLWALGYMVVVFT
jgi:hypothetical protein